MVTSLRFWRDLVLSRTNQLPPRLNPLKAGQRKTAPVIGVLEGVLEALFLGCRRFAAAMEEITRIFAAPEVVFDVRKGLRLKTVGLDCQLACDLIKELNDGG